MNQKHLNVSVIIDAITPQQWVVNTLEKLLEQEHLHLVCIILQSQSTQSRDRKSDSSQVELGLLSNLVTSYTDRALFPTDPIKTAPLSAELSQLLLNTSHASLEHADQTMLDKTELVLHLGSTEAALPENTPAAKHGIWYINTAEINNLLDTNSLTHPALHWLHLWKWTDATKSTIERVASHSLPMQSYSKTDISTYTFGALPDFIMSRLNWLANGIDPAQYESEQIRPELFYADAYPTAPAIKRLSKIECCARSLSLLFKHSITRLRKLLQLEQWQLAFTFNDGHVTDKAMRDFQSLTPPPGITWADPQLIVDGDKTHVFVEALDESEGKGKIAHALLTKDGFEQAPATVLEEPHHLSYPFVFAHDDGFYMIPETAERKTITLYKASIFPNQWEPVTNLMENINAADTTLFKHDGLWWMFTNGMSHPAVDERDQLLLFYSEDLFSTSWTPHPLNPVVTGVDRSRMAGALYQKDGELYRPSQYGAKRYGFGINVSRISALSTSEYKETLVGRLMPSSSSDWIGCHTAVNTDQFIMIDRLQRRLKRRTQHTTASYQDRQLHRSQPDQ